MNTLIVPCAGRSSRFSNMPPKYILKYPDGKYMVEKALEGLSTDLFDRIIVTVVREHIEKYDPSSRLDRTLKHLFDKKYEMFVLDDFTTCQAETVYKTIQGSDITGSFAVKDSDNYIKVDLGTYSCLDFVVGLDIYTFEKDIERLASKSFLMVNDQGVITDIIEKKIVSGYISIGMYGFNNAKLFCDTFMDLNSKEELGGELYLSHIISYLIGMNKSLFSYVEASDYEDWGTKTDWFNILKRKSTYIVNMENIVVRWDDVKERHVLIEKNVEELVNISKRGGQIVLLGAMDRIEMGKITEEIESKGVRVHAFIADCYSSHQILLKSYSEVIPYPSCMSININKNLNEHIGDVININA